MKELSKNSHTFFENELVYISLKTCSHSIQTNILNMYFKHVL